MVRQMNKLLKLKHSEVVSEVTRDLPKAASANLALNLFDIDPPTGILDKPICIDLDLDQLEKPDE